MPDLLPGTLTNPPLAVGLNGLEDWSTAQPFLDHFKMARPWHGRVGGSYGVVDFQGLRDRGVIDPDGWVTAIPPDVDAVSAVLLTELDPDARDLAGRYQLTWEGDGALELHGGTNQERQGRCVRFDFAPGHHALLEVRLTAVSTPIRNIRVIQLDNLARQGAGHVFRDEWLDRIRNYRLLRFMDWMATNGSAQREWQDRPRIQDAFYTWRGAPAELMVQLANLVGADPWFNMPHLASADWIAAFATHVRDNLAPGLRPHYEYSNEMWNMGFAQTQWAIEEARKIWPDQGDGFMQLYAARSVAMAEILDRIHGDDCVKIISSQTHWLGLEGAALDAPNWRADDPLRRAPSAYFDAYAVSGYFDGGLDRPENVAAIRSLLAEGPEARARTRLRDQMLRGGWTESGRTIANLRQTWDYHARIARDRKLRLIMYEGGTHITPPPEVQADPALAAFYLGFNYSAEMGQVYTAAMDEWRAAGGELFNLFVECARPANYGYWGLQRHLGDENPRWAATEAWNREYAGPQASDSFIGAADRRARD